MPLDSVPDSEWFQTQPLTWMPIGTRPSVWPHCLQEGPATGWGGSRLTSRRRPQHHRLRPCHTDIPDAIPVANILLHAHLVIPCLFPFEKMSWAWGDEGILPLWHLCSVGFALCQRDYDYPARCTVAIEYIHPVMGFSGGFLDNHTY